MNRTIKAVFFDLGDTLVRAPRMWLPDAKECIASLAEAGIRLGIISNTRGLATRQAIRDILPVDFPLGLFESEMVFFSSEIGIEKPHKEIFVTAVASSGVEPRGCVYCSENVVETLVAQNAGMRAVRIATGSDDLAKLATYLSTYADLPQ